MEQLLAQTGYVIKAPKRGDVVTGQVTEITGRVVYVNVGGKTEGVIADREYEMAKDFIKGLKVGDVVTAVVTSPENDSGQIILSLKRAAADSRWKIFEEAYHEGTTLTVKGKEVNRGGLLVEADGVYGFVPTSQFAREYAEGVSTRVGQPMQVKVIEVDREQNRLVLSERAVSEAEEIEKRKQALEVVDIGKTYPGKIVGIVPFGAFVEIEVKGNKLEGLVHISEISWEKVADINKALKEGDQVQVKVIGVDEANGKLALSIKQLADDPWKKMAGKYAVDTKHRGKVVRVMPYGVIVNLEKGIEGLIHASKIPANVSFAEGQEVEVFVESVDVDKRRLSLGVVVKDTKGMIYK